MTNILQKKIDDFWEKTIFRFIPTRIGPNFFTAIRLLLIPIIAFFIIIGSYLTALLLFFVAAVCDTIDGSLARKRKKISAQGIFLDGFADKLLIILVVIFLAFNYPWPALIFIAIFFDIISLISGLIYMLAFKKDLPGANALGKSKMVVQVIALVSTIIFFIFPCDITIAISMLFLILAATLSMASFFYYAMLAIKNLQIF